MLKIEELSASYDRIHVLEDVSIHVPEGKVVSIIGANGAGKSTLLKSISGLMKINKGNIVYKGRNITTLSAHRIVGLGISQVPEGRQLFAHLSVQDNIHLGAYHYFKRSNRREIAKRVDRRGLRSEGGGVSHLRGLRVFSSRSSRFSSTAAGPLRVRQRSWGCRGRARGSRSR